MTESAGPRRARRRPAPSPVRAVDAPFAAFLSFLFPGFGQAYNRQPGLAALLATPVVLLVAVVVLAVTLNRSGLLVRLLDSRVIVALIVVDVALLGWRLLAIIQAHWCRSRFQARSIGTWTTALLVVATIAMHAVPGIYGVNVLDTLASISQSRGSDDRDGRHLTAILEPSGNPLPMPSVLPGVERGERVNLLLVGIDSGVGRDQALTDTMLIVGLDGDGGSAMLSVPRDLVNAPLPDGRTYSPKLNSLLQTANADPQGYPQGGVGTLKATISNLLGVPIHYFAAVDMAGFSRVIDSLGGVVVNVEPAVADARSNLYLDAGPTQMDGELALRYVRSRYGPGNNDFVRADRQQQVITAIRNRVATTNLIVALPGLLEAVRSTVATDIPEERIPGLAEAIQRTDLGSLERAVLQPPDYVTPATGAGGAYVLVPDLARIRELGQTLLGD